MGKKRWRYPWPLSLTGVIPDRWYINWLALSLTVHIPKMDTCAHIYTTSIYILTLTIIIEIMIVSKDLVSGTSIRWSRLTWVYKSTLNLSALNIFHNSYLSQGIPVLQHLHMNSRYHSFNTFDIYSCNSHNKEYDHLNLSLYFDAKLIYLENFHIVISIKGSQYINIYLYTNSR